MVDARSGWVAFLLTALLSASFPAVADTAGGTPLAEQDGGTLFGEVEKRALHYVFTVDGIEVGTAEGEIVKTSDNSWRVLARYDIDVELVGLDLYSLKMTTKERYKGRRLVAIDTTSVENDEEHRVLGKAEGDHFVFSYDGGEQHKAAADIVPSTQLWRRGLLRRTHVLHVMEGEPFDREAEPLGQKEVETASGVQTLTGYHIDTPYETAEIWYDDEGLMWRAVVDRVGTTLIVTRRPKPEKKS